MKIDTAIRIQRQGWYLAIYLLLLLLVQALALIPVGTFSEGAVRTMGWVMLGQVIIVAVLMIGGVILTEMASLCERCRR